MFSEAPFENEEEGDAFSSSGVDSPPSLVPSALNTVMTFHVPGMPEYSAVAGAVNDRNALFDPRLFNGDSWISSECHCLRCEGLRVVGKMQSLRSPSQTSPPEKSASSGTPSPSECGITGSGVSNKCTASISPLPRNIRSPVVLLLDMDNFGFRQFQLTPPRLPKTARITNDRLLSEVFVWAFFGSCFTRYHKVWPTEDLLVHLNDSEEKEDIYGSQYRCQNIWSSLAERKRLLLTPCSGNNQGADCVMREVVQAFSEYDMLVVTGDTELISILKEERRKGRKRSREECAANHSNGPQLRFVNVSLLNKKLVPVWHTIAEQIARLRPPAS